MADGLQRGDFLEWLGVRDLGVVDGAYTLELDVAEMHMSIAQRAHGGVLFSLLDTALGRALIDALPDGQGCATVELKINYFRPIQSGTMTARGTLKEKTRRLGYCEGEITNEEGKLLARANGTFFITETIVQADRERL